MQVSNRFSNWKNATTIMQQHQQSACHHEAVEVVITLPTKTKNIGEQLVHVHAKEKEYDHKMLLKIICCIRYLAWQGIGPEMQWR